MHATRIIRMQTKIGLRDTDFTLMHLPSYYTKRRLYERFCFVSEWEVKPSSDSSYPPVAEFKERDNDNEDISDERMSLWPEGSESLPVCSWHTLLRIWKHYLPNLSIHRCSIPMIYVMNMGSTLVAFVSVR